MQRIFFGSLSRVGESDLLLIDSIIYSIIKHHRYFTRENYYVEQEHRIKAAENTK